MENRETTIIRTDGGAVRVVREWEDYPNSLSEAIDELKTDGEAWHEWSGYGEIEADELETCYRECSECDGLIAWCDSETVEYDIPRMGFAGKLALGISE